MRFEDSGGSKFTELMTDHVLGNIYSCEYLAVVNAERMPDEIGRDRRAAGPGLDGLLGAGLNSLLDFLE